MKEVKVILSPDAKEVFEYLNEEIKANHHYGNPISKKLIPKEYIIKYGVTNLFRVELPNF